MHRDAKFQIKSITKRGKIQKIGVKGYVFNSVIVPKRGGGFNEIDVLTVSPMGIHVIEAKARVNTFYGNSLSEKWTQQLGSHTYETENPILQNLTHINYLVDYLWEQVPKGRLKNYQSAFAYKKCCTVYTFGHQ